MYRTEALVIKLNKTERAAIEKLAKAERLPTSTMARRLLLGEAEQRGLIAPAVQGQTQPLGGTL